MIEPLTGNLIVEYNKSDEIITPSGIILKESDEKEYVEGVVLRVGNKVRDVSLGDRVVFKKYLGRKFEMNRKTMFQVPETAIEAIINDS